MIHWFRGALATCQFQLYRSFTAQRLAVSILLALFPGAIMLLLIRGPQLVQSELPNALAIVHAFSLFAIVFLVSMVCLLTLLLWAPANIYSELEGRSWGFISSRPGGRIASYLGKYLTAALVAFVVSVVALSISFLVANSYMMIPSPIQKWTALVGIFAIASLVYAAIFSMIGTIFIKRAMVVAAAYLILSEVVLANVPAVVNKLTVRFHLQSLGISWLGWFLPDKPTEFYQIYGAPWPDAISLCILAAMGLLCLLVGAIVVTSRQYATNEES